ncbi:MAG: hypothetical protein AAFX08_07195 [Pseudomonadota bacterium]
MTYQLEAHAGGYAAPDRTREPRPVGEEELRFIRNFHDVFLSIGLGLFAAGLGLFSFLVVGSEVSGAFDFDGPESFRQAGWPFVGAAFFNAGVMWLLAEFFARGRRLFLPSIVILLAFVQFFSGGVAGAYALGLSGDIDTTAQAGDLFRAMPFAVASATTLAILAYYLRMRLPFAMGLTGVGIVATAIAGVAYVDVDLLSGAAVTIMFLAGAFLFLLGVFFDARDPARRTRYSDNAFWLHFFAAPLIFSSVMTLVGGGPLAQGGIEAGGPVAFLTLLVVGAFAILSLLINRRALLVSGLISAAIAIAILVRETGLSGAWTGAVTLLALGGAMVLLGAGWHVVRRVLVAPFPKEGLIARIIPPEPGPDEEPIEE